MIPLVSVVIEHFSHVPIIGDPEVVLKVAEVFLPSHDFGCDHRDGLDCSDLFRSKTSVLVLVIS